MRKLLLTVVTVLAFAGTASAAQTTTLLTPSGVAVGGIWQQWMNRSLMPTYRGQMVLDFDPSTACSDESYRPLGCTGMAAIPSTTTFAMVEMPLTHIDLTRLMFSNVYSGPTSRRWIARWALLYEQAHVVDTAYLTDADRAAFVAYWHRTIPAGETAGQYWWQGEPDLGQDVPVMGEWFAADYELCATVRGWTPQTVVSNQVDWPAMHDKYPPLQDSSRALRQRQARSCGLIRSWITAATD